MQGINPADVAAGILIAAFILVTIAWGYRNHRHERAAGAVAFCFLIAGALLVWWRVSCWTGHMACEASTEATNPAVAATDYCQKYGINCPTEAPKAP